MPTEVRGSPQKLSLRVVLVNFLFAVTTNPTRGNTRMKGFVLAHSSGGYSHHGGKGTRQGHEASDHIYSSDNDVMNACAQPAFSFLFSFGTQPTDGTTHSKHGSSYLN